MAVASRDLARAQAFAEALAVPAALGAYDDLLARPDVDAVYVALPNGLHVEWAVRAARAGKHVLVEKPLAATGAGARGAAEAARAAGVLLAEGFMYRLHPQHQRLRALIADGAVGEPRLVRGTFRFFMPPEQRAAGDVRLRADLEGGALMDLGCYTVNAARMAFGAEPTRATASWVLDPRHGVDLTVGALLAFPGGRLAVLDASFDTPRAQRLEVTGSAGSLVLELPFRPEDAAPPIALWRPDGSVVEERAPAAEQFALQADHFARSVAEGRLLPPMEDGCAQARSVEAIAASARAGQSVAVSGQ